MASPGYFVDERHALYVGWVAGIALKQGLPIEIVDDEDGNHTDRLRLLLDDPRVALDIVVPYPPEDWTVF